MTEIFGPTFKKEEKKCHAMAWESKSKRNNNQQDNILTFEYISLSKY